MIHELLRRFRLPKPCRNARWGFTGDDTIRFVPMDEQCAELTDEDGKDPGGIATDVLKVAESGRQAERSC